MALQTMGLDFFYVSVDFFDNDKVLLVEQEYGSRATLLAIRLLSKIYHQGFFYRWGGDECLLFTRKLPADFTTEFVQHVVDALVKRGFFDKALYEQQGILTSETIQLHYFEAAQRRKHLEVDPEQLLVDVKRYKNVHVRGEVETAEAVAVGKDTEKGVDGADVDISGGNVDILNENAYISKQSKGKESRGEESRVEERKSPSSNPPRGKLKSAEEVLSSIPRDGVKRNCLGLVESLQQFGAKDEDIVKLALYCNYGVIGHPVWQAIADIRNAGGKILQPVNFIWARLRRGAS